ncbi:MAG: hypothetical protein BGP06_19900 [Rhizobiales bacterium 65-9]|nr:MAG: hypothetical protein BGP06_19900 [Rhizobiales bacterium 65-9]
MPLICFTLAWLAGVQIKGNIETLNHTPEVPIWLAIIVYGIIGRIYLRVAIDECTDEAEVFYASF